MDNRLVKIPGVIISVFILTIVFVAPVRNYIRELFLNKTSQTKSGTKDSNITPEDMKRKIEVQDEIIGHRLKSKSRITEIQIALNEAGFYKGQIDGKLGPQTKKAIKAFQKAKGLDVDGIVGPKTWKELSKYLER